MLPQIRNIVCAVGLGQDTGYVLSHALDEAQKHEARLHIVHSHEALNMTDQALAEIFMLQEGAADTFDQTPLDTEAKVTAYLEEVCHKVLNNYSADPELIAGIRVTEHAPKAAILNAAADVKADLIVMGSHRHTVVADALLGSTTMKVLHSAKVPVLVVRLPEVLPEES